MILFLPGEESVLCTCMALSKKENIGIKEGELLSLLCTLMGFSSLQAAIRKELNEFKSTEMEVHELSRHLTRLVSSGVFSPQIITFTRKLNYP